MGAIERSGQVPQALYARYQQNDRPVTGQGGQPPTKATPDQAEARGAPPSAADKGKAAAQGGAAPPQTVTVTTDQTLSQIARDHHVSLEALLAANPQFDPKLLDRQNNRWFDPHGPKDKGRDPDLIRPGDKIVIPAATATPATNEPDNVKPPQSQAAGPQPQAAEPKAAPQVPAPNTPAPGAAEPQLNEGTAMLGDSRVEVVRSTPQQVSKRSHSVRPRPLDPVMLAVAAGRAEPLSHGARPLSLDGTNEAPDSGVA